MSDSFVTPWTIACQVPQSPGFTRQEYLIGLPFPSPGDFLDPGSNLHISCTGRQIFYPWVTREAPLEAQSLGKTILKDINTAYVVQDNSPAPWAEMELFQQSAWGHRKSHQTSKSCASLFFFLLFGRSVVSDSVTPWTVAWQSSPPLTISWGLHKLISIELVMPSNHLTLSCSLLLLPSIFLSIRVFSNELAFCIR